MLVSLVVGMILTLSTLCERQRVTALASEERAGVYKTMMLLVQWSPFAEASDCTS